MMEVDPPAGPRGLPEVSAKTRQQYLHERSTMVSKLIGMHPGCSKWSQWGMRRKLTMGMSMVQMRTLNAVLARRVGVVMGGPQTGKTRVLAGACVLLREECKRQSKFSHRISSTAQYWVPSDVDWPQVLAVAPTKAGVHRLRCELEALGVSSIVMDPVQTAKESVGAGEKNPAGVAEARIRKAAVVLSQAHHAAVARSAVSSALSENGPVDWRPLMVIIDDAHGMDASSCYLAV